MNRFTMSRWAIFCLCFIPGNTLSAIPSTILWNGTTLARVRAALLASPNGSAALAPAAKALGAAAAIDAGRGPWSVMTKSIVAASGDKHDYLTIGSYWWNCTAPCDAKLFANCSLWSHSDLGPPGPPYADCNTSTGLPWYDHDGYGNPINDQLDGTKLNSVARASSNLALSSFLLDESSHAVHAAELLRVFFLDASTRMNPNGNYSQAIPGRCDGRGIGIIDFTHTLPAVMDAAAILEATTADTAAALSQVPGHLPPVWTQQDADSLRRWAGAFLEWLRSSPHGLDEARAQNNHGSWYDVLSVSLAAHLGNQSLVDQVCAAAPAKRIAVQVAGDGSLPMEDSRTKSENYHAYDMTALLTLADVCSRFSRDKVDLFSFSTSDDGRGLARAMQWLAPFATRQLPWPFHQIEPFDGTAWTEVYHLAIGAEPWASNASVFRATAAMQQGADTSVQNLVRPMILT